MLLLSHCSVPLGQTGCAEVDSMTEAVAGEKFRLECISCKRREEVPGSAVVDWHYKAPETEDFIHVSIVILGISRPVMLDPLLHS